MVTFWYAVVLLCLLMYVLLDGYDLGLGVLSLLERDPGRRRDIVEIVATAWDANESWLILLSIGLWAGFPAAYGTLLPALYLPVIVMLLAIVLRGVAVELVSAAPVPARGWLWTFGIGSLVAAFAQGVTIGGLLNGVSSENATFTGGSFDFLNGYSVLTGIATVLLYATAGAAVLLCKATGELRRRGAASGRTLLVLTSIAATLAALSLPATALPVHLDGPLRTTLFTALVLLAVLGTVVAWRGFRDDPGASPDGGRADRTSLIAIVAVQLCGFLALVTVAAPTLVPPALSITEAASPSAALPFLVIGVGVNIPLVLFYNWMAHRAFRGRYRSHPHSPHGTERNGQAPHPNLVTTNGRSR